MAFAKGDFIIIDYTAKVKETGEVFDTTREDTAKKERLYKEGEIYEPQLVVVGEGWMLKTLDENFPNLELDKASSIEIPQEKAFGSRDPNKVKLVPLRRLTDKGITPTLGMRIEYDGKPATIRTIGAGRVQIDFNPPLAGKTLVYEVTVKGKLETPKEKMAALIHRRITAVEATKFALKIGKSKVTIEMPEDARFLEGLQLAKRGIAIDIQKFFPETDAVEFVETFLRQKPATVQETSPSQTSSEEKAAEIIGEKAVADKTNEKSGKQE